MARLAGPEGVLLVGSDLDGELLARKRGYDFINIWSRLEDQEILELKSLARDLCEELGALLGAELAGDARSVLRQMRHDLVTPMVSALLLQRALSRIASDYAGCCWTAYQECDPIHFFDPPDLAPGVFNALVRAVGGERLAECWTRSERPPVETTSPSSSVSGLTASANAIPASLDLISFYAGLNATEQELFLESLSPAERSRMVMVQDEPSAHPICRLRWADVLGMPFRKNGPYFALDGLRARGLPSLPSMPSEFLAVVRTGALNGVWKVFIDRCQMGLDSQLAGRAVSLALLPPVALMGSDLFGAGRCLAAGLEESGTRVLSISHSGLGYESDVRDAQGAACAVALWSERYAALESRWRSGRVFTVGSLRRDLQSTFAMPVAPRNLGQPPRVLILTARQAAHHNPTAALPRHLQSWRELVALIKRRADLQWSVRGHPRYDYTELLPALVSEQGLHIPQRDRGSLLEALRETDLVVLPNYGTTAALEALALGVPVVYLRQGVLVGEQALIENDGAVVVDSVPELERAIDLLLGDPAARGRQAQQGRRFAEETVGATGPAAVERLRAVLEELKHEAPVRRADPGLRWAFDTLARLQACLDGVTPVRQFARQLARSRAGMQALRAHDDLVAAAPMLTYLQHRATYRPCAGPWRARVVWVLQARLSGPLGAPWGLFRNYFASALADDLGRTQGLWSRMVLAAVLIAVAPGLALQRWRAKPLQVA